MKIIKKATDHFLEFHKGTLNIIGHVIGFAAVFYSIYKLNWGLFAISLLLLEAGHIYNHFAGIKSYDLKGKVIFWRILLFVVVLAIFYLITRLLKS